jgi:hypothetical protein
LAGAAARELRTVALLRLATAGFSSSVCEPLHVPGVPDRYSGFVSPAAPPPGAAAGGVVAPDGVSLVLGTGGGGS